jgi:hypothetical protein
MSISVKGEYALHAIFDLALQKSAPIITRQTYSLLPQLPKLLTEVRRNFRIPKMRVVVAAWVGFALLGSLAGCMRSARIGDDALKPFQSMYSIDRSQYGLTPLPGTGLVFIEGKSPQGDYDAMLHFSGNPSRTIAFRWDGKAYQWFGEQEDFEGPRMYETADGRYHEQVVITYYREPTFGTLKGLHVHYRGPEPLRVPGSQSNWSLTLAEVNPLLRKWGFKE